MAEAQPGHAQVVIVGSSVAYHLTALGWNDVVLLERRKLTSGTTWHAAGLIGQLRSTPNQITIARYALELYPRLEAETGQATGFAVCGGLYVARTEERMVEYRRSASLLRSLGIEVAILEPGRAARVWPLMRTEDLKGALYLPGDARTRPGDTSLALAEGARRRGARLYEKVTVTGIRRRAGAVAGVLTTAGEIACEYLVNCAGMWARDLGRMAGVNVPLHAAEHMHLATEPIEGMSPDLPLLRDPDGYVYLREEQGGVLLGGFGPFCRPYGTEGIPDDFEFTRLEPDEEQVQLFWDRACERMPALRGTRVAQVLNGPESFTPDTRYMLGEAPELRRFFVAAGLNSVGIASAPGIGRALAHWMVHGSPDMDLWDVDIRRFVAFQGNQRYLRDRTVESLGMLYAMHWPFRQPETARPARRSPLHDRLADRRACFGVVAGYERPNWFAPSGIEPRYSYSYGRQNWFPYAAEEHAAVREAVGLFDLSSFAKFLVQGKDAEAILQRICANDVGRPPGRAVYTAMLNEQGGIECDLTVTRLAGDRYLVVTGAATATHDLDWMGRQVPAEARVTLTDVSAAYAVLGVMGPRSRELLAAVSDADLSNAAHPYGAAREIAVGYAPVWALRITYVGELGWELYVPADFATGVFDLLVEHGTAHGLRLAGYHALDSLRCEKGYRSWGHDLTAHDTPLQAGLDFAVAFAKAVPFLGREALLSQRAAPLTRRLVVFTLEDEEPLLFGEEPVFQNGRLVGRITSAAYGHTLGRTVALGWVTSPGGIDPAAIESGTYEIEGAGERFSARAHLKPPYDPTGARIRG